MASADNNPLLVIGKQSDSPLVVKLHPLVLLTITDYITRHTLTNKSGPIVGAVLGQQIGRQVTMEHAFESIVEPKTIDDHERIILQEPWFAERLKQYKDVHAEPPLDLTALFTLGPAQGPLPEHVPIVQHAKALYNDDTILVLFHPETILNGSMQGGKLPVSLYESFYEPGSESADKGLQVDGVGLGRTLQLKFRKLPFEVETGEAEMIGVDYVAKGAANANLAIDSSKKVSSAPDKGKGKESSTKTEGTDDKHHLSPDDEEVIATLTTKSNAIKMLQSRISLIKNYLSSLPPSYLSDPFMAPSTSQNLNHPLLRQISALQSRLPLLAPATSDSRPDATSIGSQENDVALITLLSTLTGTVSRARDLNAKATVVNRARNDRKMAAQAREPAEGDFDRAGTESGFFRRPGRTLGRSRDGGDKTYFDHRTDGGFDSGADGADY